MALAPFNPTGFALSSSSVALSDIDPDLFSPPFILTFDLDTSTITAPLGCSMQWVAEDDAEQWAIGEVVVSTATQVKIQVGSLEGSDFSGSDTFSSWRGKVVAPVAAPIAYRGINGLKIFKDNDGPTTIVVQNGSVRDYTDTVDLVLVEALQKNIASAFAAGQSAGAYSVSALLTGTITSVGTAVTGTGTVFEVELEGITSGGGIIDDLFSQVGSIQALGARPAIADLDIIHSVLSKNGLGEEGQGITGVASSTSLTTVAAGNFGTNVAYRRGGYPLNGGWVVVLLIRRDSDGHIDVCTVASGPGTPDLPTGYSKYRVIGVIEITLDGVTPLFNIYQPLIEINEPTAAMTQFDDANVGFDADTVQDAIEALAQRATFAPTLTLVGGAGNTVPVYSTAAAFYTRIGNLVFVDALFTGDGGNEGAGTGVLTLALPFTAETTHYGSFFPCGAANNNAAEYMLYGEIATGGATVMTLNYFDAATSRSEFIGDLQNNATRHIRLKFFYEAA